MKMTPLAQSTRPMTETVVYVSPADTSGLDCDRLRTPCCGSPAVIAAMPGGDPRKGPFGLCCHGCFRAIYPAFPEQ